MNLCEHCWHMAELLHGRVIRERQRCCWCGRKREIDYVPAPTSHGPHAYRPTA